MWWNSHLCIINVYNFVVLFIKFISIKDIPLKYSHRDGSRMGKGEVTGMDPGWEKGRSQGWIQDGKRGGWRSGKPKVLTSHFY